MNSFYDVLIQGAYRYDGFFKIELEYCELEIFEKYGSFLNNIPNNDKKEVAQKIIRIIYQYYRDMKKYTLHDEYNEKLIEQGLEPKPRKKNEMSNKIKADLIIAENFRDTLENYEEMLKRKGVYKSFSKEEIEDKNNSSTLSPYYKMVNLIDDYIFDLELNFFDMADKDRYIDNYIKPNGKELKDYLLKVCKKFNLKDCVNNAKELIKQFNNLNKK